MRYKPSFSSPIFINFFFIFSLNLFAQDSVSTQPEVTDEIKRVMIISSASHGITDKDIEQQVLDIVRQIAIDLNRFEVFDKYDLMYLQNDPDIQDSDLVNDTMIVDLKELAGCDEAIIVNVVYFSQRGVPPSQTPDEEKEDDRNFVERIVDGLFISDEDDYSDNIRTQITVKIESIDAGSGELLDEMVVAVSHTGGYLNDSRSQALDEFWDVTLNKVKQLYQLVSQVISVDGTDLQLHLGSDIGITRNSLFKIVQPDKKKMISGTEVTTPGKDAGLVCVTSLDKEKNQSLIIRQWEPIEPGYLAYEYHKTTSGLQMYFMPQFPEDNLSIGIQFHFRPLAAYDYGVSLQYINTLDSYSGRDHGLGIGAFGAKRVVVLPSLLAQAKIGIEANFLFRKDDDDITVSTPVLSGTFGIATSLMLSHKSDFEINFGYRISTRSSNWTYNEEDETYDAYWYETPPEVNLSGFYFTIGYKFILL